MNLIVVSEPSLFGSISFRSAMTYVTLFSNRLMARIRKIFFHCLQRLDEAVSVSFGKPGQCLAAGSISYLAY